MRSQLQEWLIETSRAREKRKSSQLAIHYHSEELVFRDSLMGHPQTWPHNMDSLLYAGNQSPGNEGRVKGKVRLRVPGCFEAKNN